MPALTGAADAEASSGPAATQPIVGAMRSREFIVLMALLISLVALAIDIMLPSLSTIASDLGAKAEEAEYVIIALVLGMGVTPIPFGLLGDAYGRRVILLVGLVIFALGGILCTLAPDFETMLIGRFVQGAGLVGPRILTVAVVRDLFEGRRMARYMSLIMMIFVIVPALAPALGLLVGDVAGWRGVFGFLSVAGALTALWVLARLPETLRPELRRPIKRAVIREGIGKALGRRRAMAAMAASSAVLAAFFAYLSTAQKVFGEIYGFGDHFVLVFGGLALCIAAANLLNARIVERVGMRRVSDAALRALIVAALISVFALSLFEAPPPFALYLVWCMAMAFCFALAFGNLSALAMHFLGDLAGLGAAIVSTCQHLVGAVFSAVIVSFVSDSPAPLIAGFLIGAITSLALLEAQPHNDEEELI